LQEAKDLIHGVGAIYVDGGKNIHIEGNKVGRTATELLAAGITQDNYTDHSHGYVIGAEQCTTTENITLINNESYNGKYEDLSVGAYGGTGYRSGITCDTSRSRGEGYIKSITVSDNVFNSPNNRRLNYSYPNNSAEITDQAGTSPFPVQRTYRITSAIIDQQGIEEDLNHPNIDENGIPRLSNGSPDYEADAIRKTPVATGNPEITSPVAGSTLSGSSFTFTWDANGTQANAWEVHIGSTAGSSDIHAGIYLNAQVDSYSASEIALPSDGSDVFVTLWWLPSSGGSWVNQSFIYSTGPSGSSAPALTSPVVGTTLSGTAFTFTWDANGTQANAWEVHIGTTIGSNNIHAGNYLTSDVSSYIASGISLPSDGSDVYVTLWWQPASGGSWVNESFIYATGPGTPALISPAIGSTLTGTALNFTWDANGTQANAWEVHIGTESGSSNLHAGRYLNAEASSYSASGVSLPADGSDVYVTLWWQPADGGSWVNISKPYSTQ